MAEKEGFEPSRDFRPLPVFETSPFSRLGISPYKALYHRLKVGKTKLYKELINISNLHQIVILLAINANMLFFYSFVYNRYVIKRRAKAWIA